MLGTTQQRISRMETATTIFSRFSMGPGFMASIWAQSMFCSWGTSLSTLMTFFIQAIMASQMMAPTGKAAPT